MLFSLVPFAIALGGAEVAARAMWEPEELSMYDDIDLGTGPVDEGYQGTKMIAHPTRLWTLESGDHDTFGAQFSISEHGMRKVAVSGAKLRALTTGDSSVFGHGVNDDETLHHFIKTALHDRRVQVDVFTGAVPGYSTEQTLDMLKEVGWDLDLDLLVIGNLWSDNGIKNWSDREWMQDLQSTKNVVEWALQTSQAWRWMRWRLNPPGKVELPVTWVRDPYATGRRRVPLPQYAQNLDRMMLEAAERNAGVIFLSPCNRFEGQAHDKKDTSWSAYFETMNRMAAYRNVPLVRGCDVVKATGLDLDELFVDNMHPSKILNREYGIAIAVALAQRGWPRDRLVPDTEPPLFNEHIEDNWDYEAMRAVSTFDDCQESAPIECFKFGVRFEYGRDGYPTNLKRAHEFYQKACDWKNEAGCMALELSPEDMLLWRSEQGLELR